MRGKSVRMLETVRVQKSKGAFQVPGCLPYDHSCVAPLTHNFQSPRRRHTLTRLFSNSIQSLLPVYVPVLERTQQLPTTTNIWLHNTRVFQRSAATSTGRLRNLLNSYQLLARFEVTTNRYNILWQNCARYTYRIYHPSRACVYKRSTDSMMGWAWPEK